MNISEYWHDKKPVPDNVKDYISSLVKGECAGSFDICGKKRSLMRAGSFRCSQITGKAVLLSLSKIL